MLEIPDPSNPFRENVNQLQRVMTSNRFIFSQGAILFAITILLGPFALIAYLAAGSALGFLALAFD